MTPKRLAEIFMNRYIAQKVGGGEMLKYLAGRIEKYGQTQYKNATILASAKAKKDKSKAFVKGQEFGYNKALREMSLYQKEKIDEAYRKGYEHGYKRTFSGVTKRDLCVAFEINESTFYSRLRRGHSLKKILTAPVDKRFRTKQ